MNRKSYWYWLLALLFWVSINSHAQSTVRPKTRLTNAAEKANPQSVEALATKPLTRQEASEAATQLLIGQRNKRSVALLSGWKQKVLVEGIHELLFDYRVFGEKPSDGRSLFISMHGGGNAPAKINDQQWKNQIGLYKPAEGIYVAPRAPTNTWNLWHESHIDSLFDQLIQAAVLAEGVNPNKVYLMGYSAGGDGVYQLAPRMADRWAAAAMMAGHPNEVTPENLRNIGFAIHVGALDKGFNRNEVAQHWKGLLDSLQRADPEGYKHQVDIHAGRAHWMQREDTVAISWMTTFRRNPIPDKVVWKQDDVHHLDFYWLAVPAGQAKTGAEVIASYRGNTIQIEKNDYDTLYIQLNDSMMDLDKPVSVFYRGNRVFRSRVSRTLNTLQKTVASRNDPGLVFSVELRLIKTGDTATVAAGL